MAGRGFPTPWAAAAIALAERAHVPIDHVITPWALTQTLDVAAQLRAGFRYVDLRAGWNGSHWCVHHAEVGTPVLTILRDVAAFAAAHRGEVMVVQVSHLDGFPTDEQVRALAEMMGEELRGVLVPLPPPSSDGAGRGPAEERAAAGGGAALGAAAAGAGARGIENGGAEGGAGQERGHDYGTAVRLHRTVGEMVKSGERVLVTFGDGDYARLEATPSLSSLPFPYSHLWPPWTLHNSYANTDDPAAMVRYNQEQVAAFGSGGGDGVPGSLFKVSWTLTTQARTVLESVLPSHPKSLLQLNARGELLLAPFAEAVMAAGCRVGNVLAVDFGSTSAAVRVARALNAMPLSANCTLRRGLNFGSLPRYTS